MNKQQLLDKVYELSDEAKKLLREKDELREQVDNLKVYAEKASFDREKCEKENEALHKQITELRQIKYKAGELERLEERVNDALAIIEAKYFVKTGLYYHYTEERPKNGRFLVALHQALREEIPF